MKTTLYTRRVIMAYVLLLIILSSVSGTHWERHLKLDSNYEVWWSMDDDSATFQVEVATTGWVGFGLSPNGGMAGADVVIGWIDNDKVLFHDRYSEGNFLPEIDEQQDWNLLWHQRNDTHTKLRFQRSLDTCDEQDMRITDETTRMIFAYNQEVPASVNGITYHGPTKRGTKSVLIKQKVQLKYSEKRENFRYWEIRSPHVEISETSDTEYLCSFFRAPVDRKHHIIKYEPVIQHENQKVVHHILLSECIGITNETMSKNRDKEYHKCYNEEKYPNFAYCFSPIAVWAIGGEAFYFPNNTGLPLGTDVNEWFMLEIHYDNPGGKRIIDNSGLRMTYTPVLRQYDSSLLLFANSWFPCMAIPPKQKGFVMSAHVGASCLNQTLPPEGMKVFSVLLHSHELGRRLILRHFRGDKELKPIADDRYYDFNYQQFRELSTERTILPNDHLTLECTYDSSRRTNVTFGGMGSKEEMCVVFLMYYPKASIAAVYSCPSPRATLTSLGVKEISDDETSLVSPITGRNETYLEFLNGYSWDENSVNIMQDAMRFAPHTDLCNEAGFKPLPTPGLLTYPNLSKPYIEPSNCNSKIHRL